MSAVFNIPKISRNKQVVDVFTFAVNESDISKLSVTFGCSRDQASDGYTGSEG